MLTAHHLNEYELLLTVEGILDGFYLTFKFAKEETPLALSISMCVYSFYMAIVSFVGNFVTKQKGTVEVDDEPEPAWFVQIINIENQ